MSKWIQPARVRVSIAALNQWRTEAKSRAAVHLWPLLALLEKGANDTTSVVFIENDDRIFWDRYARLPGDTRDQYDTNTSSGYSEDFYVEPLLLKKKPADYTHRGPSTIRTRTFLNAWKAADFHPQTNEWFLDSNYADIFVKNVLKKDGVAHRIPTVDLAVWLFKDEEFSDDATAETLEQKFRQTFHISDVDYQKLFAFHNEDAGHLFTSVRPSDDDYRLAIEELLHPVDILIPSEPSVEHTDEEVVSVLADDDPILTEVRKLIAIGSSGIIFRGCPGTSKTWYAKQVALSLVKNTSHIYKVQFHPTYGYEDFVEGYVPDEDAASGFKIIDKVFMKACEAAAGLEVKTPVVFIIDEINRGDPARIFGELLTYIEHGYRGDQFRLSYTGNLTTVPTNLVILGTMNPHDRSITQLDAALVRRFDHIDLNPSSEILQEMLEASDGFTSDQVDIIIGWFEVLQERLPYGIGHTYLKDLKTPEQLQTLWQYRMLPYCQSVLELEAEKLEDVKKHFDSMYKSVVGQQTDGG